MFLIVQIKKYFIIFLGLLLILASCNVYKSPTTVNEAITNNEKGYFKVNMKNGDELIYEKLEKNEDKIYGVKTIDNQQIKSILIEEDILNIQKQNKKSTNSFKIIGISVGLGSLLLGFGMLN